MQLQNARPDAEDPKVTAKEAGKLLMGPRCKIRRLPASEMTVFFGRGKLSKLVIDLMPGAIAKRRVCAGWGRALTKPKTAGATWATHFNRRVQTDIFALWGRMYVVSMGEAISCCFFLRIPRSAGARE